MHFSCPEMTTFSNDTGRDISKDGLGAVREIGAGKWQGAPFPVIVRSSVVSDDRVPAPGPGGAWEGWSHRRRFWTPITPFLGPSDNISMKRDYPISGNGHFDS